MQVLDGATFARIIKGATQHLAEHQATVNALNVFPVPDGDTGNNMAMTMEAACREIDRLGTVNLSVVAEAVARGSLLGARGNSGVILSQLFRGLGKSLEGKSRIDGNELAAALAEGVRTAYAAVMRPVEGTMLTVARAAAEAAADAAQRETAVDAVLAAALAGAEQALSLTPEQLPILKQAGVVDSGGKGLCYILAGALAALRGTPLPTAAEVPPAATQPTVAETATRAQPVDFALTDDLMDIRYPYDMEFLLRGEQLPLAQIRQDIGRWGDSVLVVGSPELCKVHIHSDQPGKVLDYCQQFGTLLEIEILNMAEQHAEIRRAAGLDATPAADQAAPSLAATEEAAEAPALADSPAGPNIVAVVSGDGLADLSLQLGASQIVHGGQTMNPSTEDLVSAIYRCPAAEVIVLPNNSNIVLAAEQARQMVTDKTVHVVPTQSVPQGLAALVAFQPERSGEANVGAMAQAVAAVRSGEVTFAVRDTELGSLHIKAGDTIGLVDGEVVTAGDNKEQVLTEIVHRMMTGDSSLLGLYYGLEVTEAEATAAASRLQTAFPDIEVEVHWGGQPLYAYLVSVE